MTEKLTDRYALRLGIALCKNFGIDSTDELEVGRFVQKMYQYYLREQERDLRDEANGRGRHE